MISIFDDRTLLIITFYTKVSVAAHTSRQRAIGGREKIAPISVASKAF
jgi:hypothetical protein